MKLHARRQLCDNCRTSVKATAETPVQVRASDETFSHQRWKEKLTSDTYHCAVVFSWEQVLEAKERCLLCSSIFREAAESEFYADFDSSIYVVAIKFKGEDTNAIHIMRLYIQRYEYSGDRVTNLCHLLGVAIRPLQSTNSEGNAGSANVRLGLTITVVRKWGSQPIVDTSVRSLIRRPGHVMAQAFAKLHELAR